MKRRARRNRLHTVVFLLPVLVIVSAIAYQLVVYTSTQNGTLKVLAIDTHNDNLTGVSATVDGNGVLLPYTATLPQGEHTVVFSDVKWFITPPPRHVTVLGGKTAYAIGVYTPRPVNVGVTQAGFNISSVSILHVITPLIIWNYQQGYAILTGLPGADRVVIPSGGSYTAYYNQTGTFQVQLLFTRFVLTVNSV